MNIFVAKLNFKTTSEDLLALFEQFGTVSSAKVIIDRITNRSKGYGFVEMPEDEQGDNAINQLNETELAGNTIIVKKARPREEGEERQQRSGGYQHRSNDRNNGGGYRNRY